MFFAVFRETKETNSYSNLNSIDEITNKTLSEKKSIKDLVPNLPLGQNMQYFFYETKPTLNYWMFAIIWGTISIGLFSAGIVVYNKYDVK